jgi:hypothetical protein
MCEINCLYLSITMYVYVVFIVTYITFVQHVAQLNVKLQFQCNTWHNKYHILYTCVINHGLLCEKNHILLITMAMANIIKLLKSHKWNMHTIDIQGFRLVWKTKDIYHKLINFINSFKIHTKFIISWVFFFFHTNVVRLKHIWYMYK